MDNSLVISLLPGVVESAAVMTESSSLVSCWHLQAWQRERENEQSSEVRKEKGRKREIT